MINSFDIKSLLFDNQTVKQTIFKNTFWLAVAEGIEKLLKLLLIIFVARILGAAEYGKFTFALAFVFLFVIFSDFGLSQIVTREFSRNEEKEREYPAIFSLKILLSLATLILMLIGSFLITPDSAIQKVIWILAIYALINNFSEIIYAFLRARQKMEYEALAKIFQAILMTIVGFFIILNFPSIENLSYSYLSTSIIALIFVLIFFHFYIQPLNLSFNKTIWQNFLRFSWPLGMIAIFVNILMYTDSIIMGYFGQISQVGWYNAAYKIILVTLIPVNLISQSFYPALSLAFEECKERLQKVWNYQMEIMILLALPLIVGGTSLAPKIIDFIYDPSYTPSVLVFQILIITAGTIFFNNPFNSVLIISNQQKKVAWTMFIATVINIILNLILIPKFSLYGAAFVAIITNLFYSFLLFKFTTKFTSVQPFNFRLLSCFIGAGFSSTLMYLVITQPTIYYLNVIFSILIGVGIYLICFFLYRNLANKVIKYAISKTT